MRRRLRMLMKFVLALAVIVENKEMKPRRDYDDYSKFINEAHMSRK